MWNSKKINAHLKAAGLLENIKSQAFNFIARNGSGVTEYAVQQFILEQFKKNQLKIDKYRPIVGFNASTAIPHYFSQQSTAKKLQPESLILIDIWSALRKAQAPFADITWVGYFGKKIKPEILAATKAVFGARDAVLAHIKADLKNGHIPSGKGLDQTAIDYLKKSGYKKYILHRTGHVLGFSSPHGRGRNLNPTNVYPLELNTGYTIEPGIYIRGKFGIRSEINFYVDRNLKLRITTPVQQRLIQIQPARGDGR